MNNGLSLVDSVGSGALSVTSTLVTGVTSQIDNILRGVNGLIDATKGAVPGVALLDGVLTAVQGIVSAPVTAALAGVDGVAGTLTSAASRVVSKLAGGASEIGATWLGMARPAEPPGGDQRDRRSSTECGELHPCARRGGQRWDQLRAVGRERRSQPAVGAIHRRRRPHVNGFSHDHPVH